MSDEIKIITTTGDLAEFCAALHSKPFVAVDTEFMRERTYWPILCLVQVAAEGLEAIIDPMAEIDLTPLLEVMANDTITKVFHAARQDLEIFYRLMDVVPAPLFDTQIAAMACGFGDQIGYEPLMRGLLNANIDKGSRFTDWARRPLSSAQLSYALSDVTHLRDAYPLLMGQLAKEGRKGWVEEEMTGLLEPTLYRVEPEQAWKRLKLKGVRPADMGPLIKLAEWRESEAQSRDLPRSRVLKDDAIFELARLKPKTADALSRARSMPNGSEKSRQGAAILAAVAEGLGVNKEDLPKPERRERKDAPPADIVDLLKVLLKRQCDTYDVAPRLIASSADIEDLARDTKDADIPALKGWRRKVFGDIALDLIEGRVGMRLDKGKLDVFEL